MKYYKDFDEEVIYVSKNERKNKNIEFYIFLTFGIVNDMVNIFSYGKITFQPNKNFKVLFFSEKK